MKIEVSEEVIKRRFELLKAMHTVICYMNNEMAYERWIYLIPDGADDDDLLDIATPDEDYDFDYDLFDEACKLFRELVHYYGEDGGFYCWDDPTGAH